MSERASTEEDDSPVESWKVFQNVLSVLTIIVSIAMTTLGLLYLENCPSQPGLPITMAVQGTVTIAMPIWFLLKYRLKSPITKNTYVTVFIILFVHFSACLIVYTRVLAVSECRESDVYQIGVWFMVILWVAFSIFMVVAGMKGIIKCLSDRD